jgi:UDP-3-O-[3-hydroxymyristoyl] glucosamine N-acyltransferase
VPASTSFASMGASLYLPATVAAVGAVVVAGAVVATAAAVGAGPAVAAGALVGTGAVVGALHAASKLATVEVAVTLRNLRREILLDFCIEQNLLVFCCVPQ